MEDAAVIGIGCRFPAGVKTKNDYWDMLVNKVDAVTEIRPDRFDKKKYYSLHSDKQIGKMAIQYMAAIDDLFDFDADFFNISNKEAAVMDPQQRLLLKVVWEAFEDAGFGHKAIYGNNIGVFIGGFCIDHTINMSVDVSMRQINEYSAYSTSLSLLSNRISYVFNLKGPSLTINTACSSSLVAMHYAYRSLISGDCDVAIVGGVNISISPFCFVMEDKGGFLSRRGKCYVFDSRADGYVRGEGCGVVLLKKLDVAVKDGNRIYAVLKGCGVNHNGNIINGISYPNYAAQKAIMSKVCEECNVSAGNLDYIEAHGTGTQAGDIAEARSINELLLEGGAEKGRCIVGAVKTNIGHLEAAAGIAGFIKAVLCVKHGSVPANLHFETPNPKIDFSKIIFKLPDKLEPLNNRTVLAGVNSFGFGGTNAFALIERYNDCVGNGDVKEIAELEVNNSENELLCFPVSAGSLAGLIEIVRLYMEFIKKSNNPNIFYDFFITVTRHRVKSKYRKYFLVDSKETLLQEMELFVTSGNFDSEQHKVLWRQNERDVKFVFVFSGMGGQWFNMGRELFDNCKVYRDVFLKCDEIIMDKFSYSVVKELFNFQNEGDIAEPKLAQISNLISQIALADLLISWGIKPMAFVGHSVGEITALYFSGAITLENALVAVYKRGELQNRLADKGGMLLLSLPLDDVEDIVDKYDNVSVAVCNGKHSNIIAGDRRVLMNIKENMDEKNIFTMFLKLETPYHSVFVEKLKSGLEAIGSEISFKEADIPFYSSLYGRRIDTASLNGDYFYKNARERVLFYDVIKSALEDGYSNFIEISQHKLLAYDIKNICGEKEGTFAVFSFMEKFKNSYDTVIRNLIRVDMNGFSVNWDKVFNINGKYVELPNYPWQENWFYYETEYTKSLRVGSGKRAFLQVKLSAYSYGWETDFNSSLFPYIDMHKVNGKNTFQGIAYLEIALEICDEVYGVRSFAVEDLNIHSMLVEDSAKTQKLRIIFDESRKHVNVYEVVVGSEKDNSVLVADFKVRLIVERNKKFDLSYAKKKPYKGISSQVLYTRMEIYGLISSYFKNSENIREIRLFTEPDSNAEILAEISLTGCYADIPDRHIVNPVALDIAFQLVSAVLDKNEEFPPFYPSYVERIYLYKIPYRNFFCREVVKEYKKEYVISDIYIVEEDGDICMFAENVKRKKLLYDKDYLNKLFENNGYENIWIDENLDCTNVENDDKFLLIHLLGNDNTLKICRKLLNASDKFGFYNENVSFCDDEIENVVMKYRKGGYNGILFVTSYEVAGGLDEYYKFLSKFARFIDCLANKCEYGIKVLFLSQEAIPAMVENCKNYIYGSMFWGFIRTVSSEYANIVTKKIDVDKVSLKKFTRNVLFEYFDMKNDDELLYRRGKRYSYRVKQKILINNSGIECVENMVPSEDIYAGLTILDKGSLNSAKYVEKPDINVGLAPYDVKIKTYDVALSHKALLKILGRLPDEATYGTYMGMDIKSEGIGEVIETGAMVSRVGIGDIVIGAFDFATYQVVNEEYLFLCNFDIAYADGLTVLQLCAVYYGLCKKAKLKENEKILIHNATGGIGLNAVQIAKDKKAVIFATAGSDEKRNYLKSIGIEYVFNSRDIGYYDKILDITDGYGVDVVIGALQKEHFYKSMALLNDFGRYVDLGKRASKESIYLPFQAVNRAIEYYAVDMDKMFLKKNEEFREIFSEMMAMWDKGKIKPLPVKVFDVGDTVSAFKYMLMSKHIGRVVIDFKDKYVPVIKKEYVDGVYKKDGVYFVSGGTGGLGFEIVKMLCCKNVASIIVMSRRGEFTFEQNEEISLVKQSKFSHTDVKIFSGDVSDCNDLIKIKKYISDNNIKLNGIFHCAGILADKFIKDMEIEDFKVVADPKVKGAINIADILASESLDFYVMTSSVSAVFGSGGQANYNAANAFLDFFVHILHDKGVMAFSVNLPPLTDTGMFTLGRAYNKTGIASFDVEDIVNGLERIIENKCYNFSLFDVSGNDILLERTVAKNVYSGIVKDLDGHVAALIAKFNDINDEDEKFKLIADILVKEIAVMTWAKVKDIDMRKNLHELGIDSLMLVELSFIIKKKYGVFVAPVTLMRFVSLVDIVNHIMKKIDEIYLKAFS